MRWITCSCVHWYPALQWRMEWCIWEMLPKYPLVSVVPLGVLFLLWWILFHHSYNRTIPRYSIVDKWRLAPTDWSEWCVFVNYILKIDGSTQHWHQDLVSLSAVHVPFRRRLYWCKIKIGVRFLHRKGHRVTGADSPDLFQIGPVVEDNIHADRPLDGRVKRWKWHTYNAFYLHIV